MRLLGIVLFSVVLSSAAVADTVCYERIYDAAHMKKHKLQEVSKIRLKLEQNSEATSGEIQAGFRELPTYLTSPVTCVMKQKTTSCSVEQNGGSFELVPTAKGVRLTNTSQIRFGSVEDGVVVGREVEHRVFALAKTKCNE